MSRQLPTGGPQPADVKMASEFGKLEKEQHTCEECGHNFRSLKAERRHFTIDHHPEFLVYGCIACDRHYQTRTSLARHIKKHHSSALGTKRPTTAMSTSDATPLVKNLIVPHKTEDDTSRLATHSIVKVNKGETTYTEQPSTNGAVTTNTPTTSTTVNTASVTPHHCLTD